MSKVKDTIVRNDLPPPKRPPTSFSGFFSKILPSNRPEQGGTVRIHDITSDSDTASTDLGMNPNDLTEWNFAQEKPLRPTTLEGSFGHPIQRGRSWSMQRGGSRRDDDLSRLVPKPPRASSLETSHPPELPQSTTRDDISKMLKTKEDTRRRRRSLKESGDWLGVQGADPYSGQFDVLTPTDTLSTETTSPTTQKRLAGLSQKKKTAKIAYEHAKLEEEIEKEKVIVGKERSKLGRMERAKDKLRQQQHEFAIWNQHKRQWSSAAEPNLSPVPRSTTGCNGANCPDEAAAVAVPNFSRPSISNGGCGVNQLKPVELSGKAENTEPLKHEHCMDPSTDTIVRKSLSSMELSDIPIGATGMFSPSLRSGAADTPRQPQKSEKHFLWVRRRGITDPGKSTERTNPVMMVVSAGQTQESLMSVSTVAPPPVPRRRPQQDHFADLLIPDYHLNVAYPGQTEGMKNPLASTKRHSSPLIPTTPMRVCRSEAISKPVPGMPTDLTNFPDSRRCRSKLPRAVSSAGAATATSFQSKLKGNTMPPSIRQRLIPFRSSSSQVGPMQTLAPVMQTQVPNESQDHAEADLSRDTLWSHNARPLSTLQEVSTNQSVETLDARSCIKLNEQTERDPRASASTPTTTITGFDPDPDPYLGHDPGPQCLLNSIRSCTEIWRVGEGFVGESNEAPETPSPQSGGAPCNVSTTGTERTTKSSRPITSTRNSESSVLAPETADTGTSSTDDFATPEPSSKTPPPGTRLSLTNALIKLVRGKIEGVGVSITLPQQQHEDRDKGKTIQAKECTVTSMTGLLQNQDNEKLAAVRQQRAPGEYKEAMIQEAARIAMQRSRAKEVVTTRSRTPSPRNPEEPEVVSPVSEYTVERQEDDAVNIGVPSIKTGFMDLEDFSRQLTHINDKEIIEHGTSDGSQSSEPNKIIALAELLVLVCMILFGVACAWWIVVRPAFDTRSDLWRRRRSQRSTLGDIGVFMGAAVFCVAAVFGVVGCVRLGLWIIVWLE